MVERGGPAVWPLLAAYADARVVGSDSLEAVGVWKLWV